MKNITLTILGAGVMVPTKERNPAGFLVEAGGKKILLDAGPGIIRRLTDFGYNIQDIDLVFVSHFHTDHFGDVFNLIHSRWVDDTYTQKSHQDLTILGPAETEKRFELWRKIYWLEPNESYPVNFLEGPKKIKLGKIEIETFPIHHVKWFKSIGIIIKYQGKKLVYTGDLGLEHDFESLVKIVSDANLLITEASYKQPTPNHFTIEQVKKLVSWAGVDRVLVAHIHPQHLERVKKICQKEPKFILGKDGLKIKI